MMEFQDNVASFVFLKTILDGLLEAPLPEHPKLLSRSLAALNEGTLEITFDIIFRPIQIQLHKCAQTKSSCDTVEILLECLRCLLSRSSITRLDRFFQVYICTVNILPQAENEKSYAWSEECKLALVRCWATLFSSSEEVLDTFYADENCHKKISPLIYHCLNYASEVTNIKLRSEAIKCVYTALQLDTNAAQSVLINVFPGILAACGNLVPPEPSATNHSIAVGGVHLWAGAMSVGFAVSEEWAAKAAPRVLSVSKRIVKGAASHPHVRVRKALAAAATRILNQVPTEWLGENAIPIAEGLMQLGEDTSNEVKKLACQGLTTVEGWIAGATLAEGLALHLERLPRLLRSSEPEGRRGAVALLGGYLRVPAVLEHVLTSYKLMQKLVTVLLDVSSADPAALPDAHVIPVTPVASNASEAGAASIPLRWSDIKTLEQLRLALGRGTGAIAYYFLDEISNSPAEVTILLNTLVIPGLAECWDSALVDAIFGEYLNRLETLLSSTQKSISDQRTNALQVWLLAEGLGKMARTLGATKFQPMVVRCLYPLLSAASSRVYVISLAGLTAVEAVGATMGLGGAGAVIAAHADYLCNAVGYRLKTGVDTSPLDVLALVLAHSDPGHPSVTDIVNRTVLENVVGGRRCSKLSIGHMKVLEVYLKGFIKPTTSGGQLVIIDKARCNKMSLIQRLIEHQKTIEASRSFESYEEPKEEEEENMMSEDENPYKSEEEIPVPEHVMIADAIVRSCANLLPSKDPEIQLLSLAVVEAGVCGALRESEKILLPVAHSVWSPLVGRFTFDNDALVVSKAFTLLERLTSVTGDFLRTRIIKEVIPRLRRLLTNAARESNSSTVSYTFTQQFKMQLNLLRGLGPLIHNIELEGEHFELLLDATQSYLHGSQPSQLQEACESLWSSLSSLEPNILWLRLKVLEEDSKVPVERIATLLAKTSS